LISTIVFPLHLLLIYIYIFILRESSLEAFAKQDLCLNSSTRGILLREAFAEEGIEKRTTLDSQGVVSNSGENFEEIGAEFEASGQDKKFEIEEIGIEPETSDMDWKTFSMGLEIYSDTIIQREVLQSCLMWGGLGLTEPPKDEDWENAKKIYLMDNELSVLPKNPRCPVLLTLFLQRNYKLRTIPPSFFDYMPALQILNLSRTVIKSLPESILRLVSLKRLYLNDCHRFMILSPKVGELKQLEVLDLEGTDIMDLPREVKKLTNLTCLEVSLYAFLSNGRRAMQSDVVIPCSIISALSHLEELNISVNPDDKRWNECVEAIVTEVCTLVSLNTLKFYFPRVELLRHFLLNSPMWVHPLLSHFRFTVGHHVKRGMTRLPCDVEFELERWERCLKYINGVTVPREIKKVLQYSTSFFLERHATVKKLSDFGIGNMKQLKCCVVGECNEVEVIMEAAVAHEEDSGADAHEEDDEVVACEEDDSNEIVSTTSGAKKIVLGALEYLCIYYMKNLRRIWEGPVQPKCLSLLKSLTLRTCPQLTTIFTNGLLDNLCNLEELTIEDCPSIKTLVSCEISAEHKTSEFLPNLKRISLHYMPGLVSISSGLHIAPRLEWMSFYNCPNLKHLLIEEVSSQDLKKIKGEWNWWVALKWRSGRPSHLDEIFVPINILDC
jgi:disease resistance protein RPS2